MTRRILALFAACAALALAAPPPTPEAWFGHRMGEDRKLVDWAKVVGYFEALDAASHRVRVERIGKTVDGKPMIAAFIADAATISALDRFRGIQARLADPRRTPTGEAERLIAQGKVVVMITCSIHSTEVASTLTAIEFAHRLITEDRPKFRAILANTIFILVPSLNPDGVDIVAQWYRRTLGTPWEGASPPELYHRYLGHDNNRDWYIFSQPETRNVVSRLHNVWRPQIVYDVHQQGQFASRMFVPPWMDPIEPNIDPLIAQMCTMFGAGMATDLTAADKTGVVINAIYDFWTPARHYQAYHGGVRILSESASARLASPINVRPEQIRRDTLGYDARERSWNHLEPWLGGTWRLRDIVEYQLIALESCLYQAAVKREDLLRSFWIVGQRAVACQQPPGFVIPFDQFDPGSARKLAETLAFGDIEIERRPEHGGYVIRMQQPYSAWAKTLLERQNYPDLRLYPGGPPKRPYDVTAHTLPLLMGVDVRTLDQPLAGPVERATRFEFSPAASEDGDIESFRAAKRRKTRIGLYRSWDTNAGMSMDEGWTRWLLEQFGYACTRLDNTQVQAGSLNTRFDVIIFADQTAKSIHEGNLPGSMPPEYVGGVGEKGAAALKEFAGKGGTLVFLNRATEWAITHLALDVKNVVRGLSNREFYSPGSILSARADTTHPLARGLPQNISLWSEHSPAFELPAGSRTRIVVRYSESNPLASGWLLGDKYLRGRAALVDVPLGSGHVLLFGMRPQYRAQSYQTFKLFFNALTY
ncbi:MAG TPA: M14 metallopeptidase family protein [Bryobacteraceae bacterium]|nr:M14 metallopeptidase family protein [Bryobacteraceae bacterium]